MTLTQLELVPTARMTMTRHLEIAADIGSLIPPKCKPAHNGREALRRWSSTLDLAPEQSFLMLPRRQRIDRPRVMRNLVRQLWLFLVSVEMIWISFRKLTGLAVRFQS